MTPWETAVVWVVTMATIMSLPAPRIRDSKELLKAISSVVEMFIKEPNLFKFEKSTVLFNRQDFKKSEFK